VGGGFNYGHNGVSHYALEDIALMRVQPGMSVVAPADPDQTRAALAAIWDTPGPLYLRLGRESKSVPGLDGHFESGRLSMIGGGEDVLFVTLGTMAREAVGAAELLSHQGIAASVAVVASVSPSPEDHLADLLSRVPLAVSLEAHYTVGGVGSLVAEVIAERGLGCRLIRQGVRSMPRGDTGGEEYLYARHGLSRDAVAGTVVQALSLADR
jgi:transketolase